jgi:predicted deacylase
MLHSDSRVLEKQRALARAFNLPVIWGTDAQLEGRSLSVARDARIPAIYAEYLGGGNCSAAGIAALVEGCLNVMGRLKMIDRAPPPSNVHLVVEDTRPGAGHMQRCHPSPADGCFETFVNLGQHVVAGQCLGHVVDPLGSQQQDVPAGETGTVLVLRTCCSVRKGDSLAVILPDPK